MNRMTLPLALLLASIAPNVAHAGQSADALTELRERELPQIEETGIELFDSVFRQVQGIHTTLDNTQSKLFQASDAVAAAVNLPAGTPIQNSIYEFKQIAGGPIQFKLEGTKPVLSIGGASSAQGQQALQNINTAVAVVATIPADLAQLPAQVMELVNACKALPSQLNPQLLADAGMTPMQLPKVAKTLGKNVKATAATPARIDGLLKATKGLVAGIPLGIKATEPPAAVAIGKDAKQKKKKEKAAAGGAADAPEVATAPPSKVAGLVDNALVAFHDAEVRQAAHMLAQVDQSLATVAEPIPVTDLQDLYQTSALVHLVDGNAAAATASVAQALVVDPDASPLKDLGPEYAKLHKAIAKSGVIRTIDVPVQGAGTGFISGQPISGGSTVSVSAGKHLLQIERNGTWTSQVVWVGDGFTVSL